MSKQDKDQILANFTQAYTEAHGKAPTIEAKGGWYSVDGGKNVRITALEEMIEELTGGQATAPTQEPSAKKADKPAAKAKAAPAKKNPKSSKTGFSVKAFWAQQIVDRNPGSKLPR